VKKSPPMTFAPITLAPNASMDTRLEMQFANGVKCFIPNGVDGALLNSLIKAMN